MSGDKCGYRIIDTAGESVDHIFWGIGVDFGWVV
jgi:hypothetical protein